MDFHEILSDKSTKPKDKTVALSQWLIANSSKLDQLIVFAAKAKDPIKAACIEAMEFATKIKPDIATEACLDFVSQSLIEKAPRVKWESAKVIGNIAHLYPASLNDSIKNLIVNTEHHGTVVRWAAAYALGEIVKVKTPGNKELIPAIEAICEKEEKNSIKKIYIAALKKVKPL